MTWAQIATLIVSITAVVVAGTGVVVLSVNGIHSQVATMQAEGAADRRAWQATMDAFRTQAEADRRAWQASLDAFQAKADADRDALRAEAEADREAFREEVRRLGERQARVEGALSTARVGAP